MLAAAQVKQVQGTAAADIYGGLCHNFPIMLRSLGLCQTLAYYEAKATQGVPKRRDAYSHRLNDVRAIAGIKAESLSTYAAGLPVLEYMQLTREVLDAAIFFKRFAVSILKVENAGSAQED
jgi:CRISPR-associated protein Cmr5